MFKNILDYDYYVVAFSGGKDSICCVLELLERGVPKDKIELWHHCIDGKEGSALMDWPVTPAYCDAFADAIGIKIYMSWKEGGFEREMNRKDSLTAPSLFEVPIEEKDNLKDPVYNHSNFKPAKDRALGVAGGKLGKPNTRLMFPQVAADLRVRWCSAYLKIDVCSKSFNNQKRFLHKRTLFMTGERAQESTARARYKTFEPYRGDNRNSKKAPRHIDHWRPIHSWPEEDVWQLISKYKIKPHPAYILGWGRLSCMACIFGSANQWASAREVSRTMFTDIARYESQFKKTIHRKLSVTQQADKGEAYEDITAEVVRDSMSKTYSHTIIQKHWTLPAGAFGESTGPT